MTFDFLLPAVLGYLLGSIPTAYLLVRWKSRKDVRKAGSGNVGALNSYLVTRSRLVGVSVLLLDLLKGIAAVVAAELLLNGDFAGGAVAGIASVIGHNFSVWINFKGGRGLATAAGVALSLTWPIVPVWLFLWGVSYFFSRNVNVGNAIATALLIVGALTVPSWLLEWAAPDTTATGSVRIFMTLMLFIILIKHVAPIREFLRNRHEVPGAGRAETEAEKENT